MYFELISFPLLYQLSTAGRCSKDTLPRFVALQVYNPEDTLSASLMRTSPSGAMTPPLPGMRPAPAPGGGLPTDALAALLAQTGGTSQAPSGMPQFAPPPPQQPGAGNGE